MTSYEQLLERFDHMDKDKNGELSTPEVKEFLCANEFPPQYITKFMATFDTNKDGKITRAEYTTKLKSQSPAERRSDMWRAVFDSFDKDGSGKLSPKEISEVLKGNNYDKAELVKFIKEYDKDGDGELDYNEFLVFLTKN